jgi:predicted dehydrogenase
VGGSLTFGIIGVGKISEQYFASLPSLPGLRLLAVADLDESRAATVAGEQGVESMSVDAMMADDRIQAILNLTIPAAHADVDLRALTAGKHVYGEKPLALSPSEAAPVLALAASNGLRVGSAPDTVLGTGVQTARAILDRGDIGDAVGASAFWAAPGHEAWHPAPEFYYQAGAGPLFDMGPYYLSALVTMLGPVVRVSGTAGRSSRHRSIATGPRAGASITVDIDTHVTAMLEHESGVTSAVTMSFEVWASRQPPIEVFGTAGTIAVPDPNQFSEPVEVFRAGNEGWAQSPTLAGYAAAGRGYGLADMARAIETDRPHRASGEFAFHVLEIMDAILVASEQHAVVPIASRVDRPSPVPLGSHPNTW